MAGRVLVVDDIPTNVKLLEAKLVAEYFDVIPAYNGAEALEAVETQNPDIVLLDVMMPGMNGYDVCKTLKSNKKTRHIPVVMVTALDQQSEKVRGLAAGADDFLTKPVDDLALIARVKSLVRLKTMNDELRMRNATGREIGLIGGEDEAILDDTTGASILVIEDKTFYANKIQQTLDSDYNVCIEPDPDEAMIRTRSEDFDMVIVSLSLDKFDGLRVCSQLRAFEETRQLPLLVLVDEDEKDRLARGLELGVNDYLLRPVDRNELVARVETQIKWKRYADQLRADFQASLELAVTDQLTGLHNRRYLATHLDKLVDKSVGRGQPVSLLIMDIDFFKAVNDTYGHDVGDEVLKEFARRLQSNVRGIDLACRYGGEEFVVVMPDTDQSFAYMVAERLRQEVAEQPFNVNIDEGRLNVTISIGITTNDATAIGAQEMLKSADQALYRAKRDGRNRVVADAA